MSDGVVKNGDVDWCTRAAKLRKVEEALLAGEVITETRFGMDMVRWAETANLTDVKAALDEAIRNCAISRGEKPGRRRYAMRARARPY